MKRLLSLGLILTPGMALAHPGDHSHTGLTHFLTEPDHLATIALTLALAFAVYRFLVKR